MTTGGPRPGAGRKRAPRAPKLPAYPAAKTPVQFFRAVMDDATVPARLRMNAAKEVARLEALPPPGGKKVAAALASETAAQGTPWATLLDLGRALQAEEAAAPPAPPAPPTLEEEWAALLNLPPEEEEPA